MGYDPIVFRLKAGGFIHLSYEPDRFGLVRFNFFKPGFAISSSFVGRLGNDPSWTSRAVAFTARTASLAG